MVDFLVDLSGVCLSRQVAEENVYCHVKVSEMDVISLVHHRLSLQGCCKVVNCTSR